MRMEKRVINKIFKPRGYVTYRGFTFTIHAENIYIHVWIQILLEKFFKCDNELEMFKIAISFFKERINYYRNKKNLSKKEKEYRISLAKECLEKAEKEYRKLIIEKI